MSSFGTTTLGTVQKAGRMDVPFLMAYQKHQKAADALVANNTREQLVAIIEALPLSVEGYNAVRRGGIGSPHKPSIAPTTYTALDMAVYLAVAHAESIPVWQQQAIQKLNEAAALNEAGAKLGEQMEALKKTFGAE